LAAEDLLSALVLNNGGLGLKHIDDVMTAMKEPIFQRARYVSYVATTYGVEERSAGAHRAASKSYTTEEWFDWYETHSLSDGAMDEAIQQWKADFPCQQRNTIATLEKEGSRVSKKRARDLLNGAFKVYLRDVCGIRKVAIELLRNPTKDLERILWKWAQYMNSPEYHKELDRSRQIIDEYSAEAQLRQEQRELKLEVHRLRAKYRNMRSLHNKMSHNVWRNLSADDRQSYEEWQSGAMEQELNELTKRHGYGKVR